MSAHRRPVLLVTLRDPGPASLIAHVAADLDEAFHVHLLCCPRDRTFASNLNCLAWTSVEDDRDVLLTCRAALRELAPDVVLRTTPAYGTGVDEAIVDAVRELKQPPPILCLQDHYGLGRNVRWVDRFGVMDAAARDCMPAGVTAPVDVLGWLAHERFLSGDAWNVARARGRAKLELANNDLACAYIGICSDSPDADSREFLRFLKAAQQSGVDARWCLRTHPRTPPHLRDCFQQALVRSGLPLLEGSVLEGEREWMAVFDLLVSPASAMLIDALAFFLVSCPARCWIPASPGTVGLYLMTRESQAAMTAASGLDRFPTHQPGHGFAVSGPDELSTALRKTLICADVRRACVASGFSLFRPSGGGARRLRTWLQGVIND